MIIWLIELVEQHETDAHNKLVTQNHNIQSVEDQYLQIKELRNIIKVCLLPNESRTLIIRNKDNWNSENIHVDTSSY